MQIASSVEKIGRGTWEWIHRPFLATESKRDQLITRVKLRGLKQVSKPDLTYMIKDDYIKMIKT